MYELRVGVTVVALHADMREKHGPREYHESRRLHRVEQRTGRSVLGKSLHRCSCIVSMKLS